MAVFHVDSDALMAKSGAVQGTIDRLRGEVEAMQQGLRELESLWTGAAASTFQQLVAEWRITQQRVEESLVSINGALNRAAIHYSEAEAANTRLFTI